MSRHLTVSIIIGNHNYGRFLGEAIESALSQSYSGVEVIVVDDGSTDESEHVINRYSYRLRAIFKKNGGQASALNAGYAVSTGSVVFFLDADDVLLPTATEAVAEAWADGMARAQFPLEMIDAAGRPLGRQIGGCVLPSATAGPFGVSSPTSGNAFSRMALDRIMPIPEDWRICADSYLTAASSLLGDVLQLERSLGKYRVHGENNVAGITMGLPELRRSIDLQLKLHEFLRRIASDQIGSLESWLGAYPQHWVARIQSLRESPSDHPWPDSLPSLIQRAISATWRQPYWNVRRKLAYTVLAACYGFAPAGAVRALKQVEGRARQATFWGVLGNLER